MKSNYKTLGNYIHKVESRNSNLKVEKLLGLSMTKEFREPTSNIVGTDMSVYKVVSKWQFSCDFMSVIRVFKLPVVLKTDDEPILVSPAYTVFEINDSSELNPEYLMMWFRRPEFDRYAVFKCDSAIRGGYDWNELFNTKMPIPHIDKQKEIVSEYNVLVNRIELNNQFIQKLKETAQAIYKLWFIDFEFPNENEKSYKSNGGEMEFSKEIGSEIPMGWEVSTILSLCEITSSKRIFEEEYTNDGIPFYRGKEISLKKLGVAITDPIYISTKRYNEIISLNSKPEIGDILMTAVGTIGVSYLVQDEKFYFKDGNVIWFKDFKYDGANLFLYDFMQSEMFCSIIKEITIGSTQNAITIITFGQQKIVVPQTNVLIKYKILSSCINDNLNIYKKSNIQLTLLKDILLSKLATVKN